MNEMLRMNAVALLVSMMVVACGGQKPGDSSTTGEAASSAGGGSTTGRASTGHFHGSTTNSGTSGSGTTGSSGGASTGTSSSGTAGSSSTSGTSGGATAGSTSSGSTSSGSSGGSTTGPTPPYQGYDAGPRPVLPIDVDAGCCASAPIFVASAFNFGACSSFNCVQCRKSADCPPPLKCDVNDNCVPCRGNQDCPLGTICQPENFVDNEGLTHPAGCILDCRTQADTFCNPGLCDGDGGGCLPDECTANSQCVVGGRGACDFNFQSAHGFATCAPCTSDAGGCLPDEVCLTANFAQSSCQLNCLLDSGVCQPGTSCGDAGLCVTGCVSQSDCIGSSAGSICHQGQCVSCLGQADCPASAPGCGPGPFQGSDQCGFCASSSDCPPPLHCETNNNLNASQCRCHADNECDPFRAPVCMGLDVSMGFPQGSGRCGCRTTADCPSQEVCETRQPYSVVDDSGNLIGGACIPSCNTTDTDCTTAGITVVPNLFSSCGNAPPANDVCDTSTGYCVPCGADLDCRSGAEPRSTPSCTAFPGGANPFAGGLLTGGGLCGCSDTRQCDDGLACGNAGLYGSCTGACSFANGVDSCAGSQRFCPSFAMTPYCNTFTGACQGCLSDHDCLGTSGSVGFGNAVATPICDPVATSCVQCTSPSQCPVQAPNCTQGFCGFCQNNADCSSGWQCVNTFGSNQCELPCVPDSQEKPTAGSSCPAALPFCANIQACFFCPTTSICAQCRPDFPRDCPAGQSCSFEGICQ
jgi:hypothetical protein